MAAPDITGKFLIEHYAADYLRLAGVAVGRRPVRVVDADLSTLAAAADKVVRVGTGDRAVIVNIEFQVGPDRWLDDRVLLYHAALRRRHHRPVRSVVFALRRSAVPPAVRGGVSDPGDGHTRLDFAYHLVRLFDLDPAALLAASVGTLPLVALSAAARDDMPGVIRTVRRRIEAELPPATANELLVATGVLLGLRYNRAVAQALIGVIPAMRESSVYRHIMNEGRIAGRIEGLAEGRAEGRVEGQIEGRLEGERETVFRLATAKFGHPSVMQSVQLDRVTDPAELDRLALRLLTAKSWEELLGVDPPGRRTPRRGRRG